ncbi:hypothetical protein G3I78_40065 [Streptomyces sp. SID13726]|nr:hypothetical protein [Streptomyces sp. SID13726]
MVYQIPPEPAHFVDRDAAQERVLRALDQHAPRNRPFCVVLSGYAGLGKTELAFRLARLVEERYPDGVLYADLDDVRRDGAVETADVLGALLRALETEAVEPTHAGRARQYWSRTRGKRLVLVLDNARYGGTEVEALLPASGDSLVIVTSHGPLYDLQAGAAVELPLDPLTEPDALDLLERITRDARLADDPEPVRELLSLCGGLPAALHVAGRWMRRHAYRPLHRLTGELRAGGTPEVEQVWDAAYRTLTPEAARLYRLLADLTGPTVTLASADALLGKGTHAAGSALEELHEAGLLDDRDQEPGRSRLPGLLRAHARRRAEADEDPAERDTARRRVVGWYLRQAQNADLIAAGPRLRFHPGADEVPGTRDVLFDRGDGEQAAKRRAHGWLEAERHALFACVRLADEAGACSEWGTSEAWALCEPLWTHFLDHPHYADHIDAFRIGVAAAQRAGEVRALVRMRCQLARPLWEQGEFEAADRELTQAWSAVRAGFGTSPEERKLAASTREFHGMLRSAQGDWADAAGEFEASGLVHEEIGNAYGATLMRYRLGEALAHLGQLERAADLLTRARDEFAEGGRARLVSRASFALGGVLYRLERADEARELYAVALSGARGRGGIRDEIRVLDALAELESAQGRTTEATEHRDAARVLRERCGLE